jgi:1-acyl-sn-glycerol-3-phosphate acyltransferase
MNIIKRVAGAIFVVYALTVFFITMLVVILPIWLMSKLPDPYSARFIHPIFKGWMSVYMPLIFCPVVRKGKHHFAKGENYVVVLNHNSLMDIPVSSPWIPGANRTLGKIEITKIPVFSIIYTAGAILVDRKDGASRRASFVKMQEALEKGINLCLYPEGTRNKTDKPLQHFFDGAFATAVKTQKPIIPGLLFNTRNILPHTIKFWAWPGIINIHFLEPIPTKGLTLEDVPHLKEKIHTIMETYYLEHLNELS